MAIKLKNSAAQDGDAAGRTRKRAARWAALALAALSAVMLAAFMNAHGQVMRAGSDYYEFDNFVEELRLCLLTRYWQARCEWDGACAPSKLFLSDENALHYAKIQAGEDLYTMAQSSTETDSTQEDAPLGTRGGLEVYTAEAADCIDGFNEAFRSLTDSYTLNWNNLYCTLVDDMTGRVYAPRVDLSALLDGAALDDAWNYLQITRYDAAGTLNYQETFHAGADAPAMETPTRLSAQSANLETLLAQNISHQLFNYYDFVPPHDVTMIFAIPRVLTGNDTIVKYADGERHRSLFIAYDELYNIALLCALCLALLFGRKNGAGLGRARLAQAPLEISLLLLLAGSGILVRDPLYTFLWNVADGTFANALADSSLSLDPPAGPLAAYAAAFLCLWAVLGVGFALALSIRQAVNVYGMRELLTHRFLLWRGVSYLWDLLCRAAGVAREQCGQFWRAATRVDLREPSDHTLARLLILNAVILSFICCFWFAGIVGVLIYTVLLFFLLRGRMRAEQQNYQRLLDAVRRMAAGDLTTPVAGEMGMFNPLRDTLNEVRAGFEKAVDEEVRSRNMKTELITNVSHDLKTPLTAIITYIGLLKDPDLAPEVRGQYIRTLDNKSQRLKRLIEDLFEISKAASGNAVMHYAEVDLTSLLRQAACELEDAIAQSGVDFRWQMPEHRVPLILDGQKTYRIFENLLVNITKYALPGTRAYITLTETPEGATVECKNVSTEELNFDTAAITERFVRGDRSRSTEGSGLGLAIVKSFAELQGGSFTVATDGDLFKATVFFARGTAALEDA